MEDEKPAEPANDTVDVREVNGGRDLGGKFARGNPGRRRGSKNRIPRAVRSLVGKNAEAIVQALVERALEGNVAAATALLRLVVSPMREKPEPMAFSLPKLSNVADSLAALSKIADGAARGELDHEQAQSLTALVAEFRSALQLSEVEQRIGEWEAWKKVHGQS